MQYVTSFERIALMEELLKAIELGLERTAPIGAVRVLQEAPTAAPHTTAAL